MIYKKVSPNIGNLSPTVYCIMSPVSVKIRDKNGIISNVRYGIGDKIKVLEPIIQFLIVNHEKLNEIPLDDGSFIIEYPDDISYIRESD